ncbi:calcium-binding protein [Paracraurococcus lichenis]|uniref:Calcium-binding protein n=1 Tax=Paracraurococcus lichenis TaxID=3064888 RepID=A0ABT9DZH1_9PROT|nr:calcium-binding protein [Paracraurococcus sp. LOR1-02]MDO9709289.1 calcium-binding protein [Paracraurococcus sp. LOR1-02]
MGDFASVIGSGSFYGVDHFGDVPKDLSTYYHLATKSFTLDLSDRKGDDVIDGTDNHHAIDVTTGSGNDDLLGSFGGDALAAGRGDDTLYGWDGDDQLSGGADNDVLFGGNGDDTVHGDAGDDHLDGGKGADELWGDKGDDSITGGLGDDSLYGGDGEDSLLGGSGNDLLDGGKGWDTLDGGAGDDTLIGGLGNDTFVFDSNFGDDVIADFGAKDQIWLSANINDSGITNARDVAQFVSGDANHTTIKIGDDSIRLEGVGKDDFLQHLTTWVKVI